MATQKKYFCPRLVDYIMLVGARRPNNNNDVSQTPELMRRYPHEDHKDFPLPPDVIYFCQPEGCLTVGQKRLSMRENTSFVFTLTDKDSGRMRYGICINFYRPFKVCERKTNTRDKLLSNKRQNSSSNDTLNVPGSDAEGTRQSPDKKSPRTRRRLKQAKRVRNNSLTSLCIISHHPFISTFRECLFILKKLIDSCNERTSSRKVGGSKGSLRDSVWGVLTGICTDIPPLVRHDVRQIETWMLRFLSAPVPVPGKTRVELEIMEGKQPMIFALPDHTRFSLADFPLHLPLELLGVETCLKVMTLIMLEHKVVLQSRDYNALSMSVMAFVAMIYPLEYMFPVIPLLPTCMGSAEQLLLAPTPFIIGVPASFFLYKKGFSLPDDVFLVDLDSNKADADVGLKIRPCGRNEHIPVLPEPEGTTLKTHLKQALASMSLSPPPIKDFEQSSHEVEAINRRHETDMTNDMGFNPFIFGNDVDSVDVATRAAMVRFFNSANVLAHITEHTRTLRLHPRPVVAFQAMSFLASRTIRSKFTEKLARTQAVEYYGEFCLNPTNVTFLRIHTGMYDPQLIGDKGKWYSEQLQPIQFKVFFENCTLGTALENAKDIGSDSSNPTDESGESDGEESDDGGSSSSSYSSLNDFVTDMMNSEIHGDISENQEDPMSPVSEMDTNVYNPPDTLQIPADACQSDSAYSCPESDSSSSQEASTSPDSSDEEPQRLPQLPPPRRRGKTATSGGDTDGDAESLQYDSDTPSDTVNSMRAKMAAQLPKFSKSLDESASRAREERKKEKSRSLGRTSPTFLDKVNALFRSDSSDSSAPPSPTKTSTPKKPSLLKGIMDLALESTGTIATNLKEPSSPTSVRSTDNTSGYAPSVHSDPGLYRTGSGIPSMGMPARRKKNSSPFPKDTRRSLVERSSLIRHSSTTKPSNKDRRKQSLTAEERPNSEDQQFLKEITRGVMDGNNVGWLNWSRLKKLMQNENLRAQVISQLMPQESTVTEDYIEDTQVSKAVYKGLVSVLKAVIAGLEHSYEFHTVGGMASAFAVLELSHTHYFGKEPDKGGKDSSKDGQNMRTGGGGGVGFQGGHVHCPPSEGGTGSSEYLQPGGGGVPHETHSLNEDNFIAAIGWGKRDSISVSGSSTSTEEGGVRVHSPRLEDNRNDSSYEMIEDSEMPIGMTTGAGVHGAVGIAAGLAVTGVIGDQLDMTPLTGKASPSKSLSMDNERNNNEPLTKDRANNNNNLLETIDDGITFIARTEVEAKLQSAPSPQNSTPTRMNEIIQRRERFSEKISSMDSEVSEASTLVSFNSSDTLGNDSDGSTGPEGRLRRTRITHHSIRSVMSDSEVELNGISLQSGHRRKANRWSTKSCMSAGFRYHNGNMIATDTDTAELMLRHYVFEALIAKDRSLLWDQLQFWEDAYLDAVAAERDAVGMDQGPAEMIRRYESLGPKERKRLEEDEDILLADMLYNMTGYMIMIKVPKPDIKRKIRRLLGRSHIGLLHSQEVTDLLDQINNLHGNDVDLKPSNSRQMRKHSFVVHAGSNTRGDVLFMEVCDDCVIIRSGNGAVCDRCWYERLVNMTYCPKTKVLCLWRRINNTTKLDKFYTKKCRELYFCIKESMEKAATRQKNGITGEPELGGEFPIQDLKSGQGGLLQVTMEGIGLKFSQTKENEAFIELKDIKEYKTKKDVFMLVEFDQHSQLMVRHKFRSSMAHDIGYAMLCVFSYVAAARSAESMSRKELEFRMAGRRREFLQTP